MSERPPGQHWIDAKGYKWRVSSYAAEVLEGIAPLPVINKALDNLVETHEYAKECFSDIVSTSVRLGRGGAVDTEQYRGFLKRHAALIDDAKRVYSVFGDLHRIVRHERMLAETDAEHDQRERIIALASLEPFERYVTRKLEEIRNAANESMPLLNSIDTYLENQ